MDQGSASLHGVVADIPIRLRNVPAGSDPGDLSPRNITVLASVSGIAIANLFYAQPLLPEIGRSLGMTEATTGLIPALSQIGLACGILFVLPLGDVVPVRRLLTLSVLAQAAILTAMACGPAALAFLTLSLMLGFFGLVPYILPPYATLRTAADRRGRVTSLLAQGVLVGMLLARTISGTIGLHFGWRSVYAMAAVVMLLTVVPLRCAIPRQPPAGRTSYRALMLSLIEVFLTVPLVRWSALCQGLATGSFTVLWIGISFYMQGPAFHWQSDKVGGLALIGAAAAFVAPFVGGFADRRGPERSLIAALGVLLFAWVFLAVFGGAAIGVIVGMIVLDLGATATDISNRTVIFNLRPEIRTRLATIYMVGKFAGGGIMAWLTGFAWADWGWPGVCALGAAAALLAGLTAWIGVVRAPRVTAPATPGMASPTTRTPM
jgi:predicted MFS family arabinose efflux permease